MRPRIIAVAEVGVVREHKIRARLNSRIRGDLVFGQAVNVITLEPAAQVKGLVRGIVDLDPVYLI